MVYLFTNKLHKGQDTLLLISCPARVHKHKNQAVYDLLDLVKDNSLYSDWFMVALSEILCEIAERSHHNFPERNFYFQLAVKNTRSIRAWYCQKYRLGSLDFYRCSASAVEARLLREVFTRILLQPMLFTHSLPLHHIFTFRVRKKEYRVQRE